MILVTNGDSHTAGAELYDDYCFANDDPDYVVFGRKPHPSCLMKSFGEKIANMHDIEHVSFAESASSNQRIIRTTPWKYLSEQPSFLLVGWSTWEREEWELGEEYYQLTASGADDVPEGYKERYKDWVRAQTPEMIQNKMYDWNDRIYQFHLRLKDEKIKHLFFNAINPLEVGDYEHDFGDSYFHPYEKQYTMCQYLKNSKHNPNKNNHYNEIAHADWANVLYEKIRFKL